MKKLSSIAAAVLLVASAAYGAPNQETQEACAAAAELAQGEDVKAALEEARWCVEGLEQDIQNAQAELFEKNIDGWVRGEVSTNKGMGMTVTQTEYSKDKAGIEITLTSGAGAMGNVLAQMGMMQGVKRVRLGKLKGIMTAENELSVSLPDGRLLSVQGQGVSNDDLIAFVKKLPLDKLSAQ